MQKTARAALLTFAALLFVFGTFFHWFTKEEYKHYSTVTVPYKKIKQLYCPKPIFSKKPLPITALASYPGCGNTWVRHLIQSMTGILTGAIYNDTRLRLNGFPGEGFKDGRVIAVKTHSYHWEPVYNKTVLIMRNPYSAFMAEFNRQNSKSHTGSAKIDKFVKNWNTFLHTTLHKYRRFYLNWIKTKNLHIVMFDNLVDDMENELRRLLKYLRRSSSVVGNVQCALTNSTGAHKRDHSKSAPVEFFYSKGNITRINTMIDELYRNYTKRFKRQADKIISWKLPLK